ncbi:MAG: efflux transporter outer membrane subunit [Acidobacteriota bacterium]
MLITKNHPKARRVSLALLALAGLLSTGCTGLAQPQILPETPDVPASWTGTQLSSAASTDGLSAEELAVWWRQLGDPVLDELVTRIVSGNLDLQTAAARVAEARARRGLSRSELGPSVSGRVTAGRTEPLGDGIAGDSYTATLETSWEADLFGANRLALAASQADLEAGVEDLRAARVAVVAETVAAYADVRVAEARLKVVDDSLASREETYQLTTWREQANLASRLEVNQAASSLEQTRAERPTLERRVTEARLRLALLAGESPGALDELLTTPAAADVPAPPNAVSAGIPADALRQRPDVRSAERGFAAAWARLGVAQAARYPTLRLTGSLDAQSPDLGDLFDADAFFGNLLAGLTAPIFESGRIRENIAVREAQVDQAALAYQSAVLGALSEVETALAAFYRSQERIAALDVAMQAATEASELADQRYAAGLVDLLSVLETERTLFTIQEQLVTSRGELLNAFSSLYRALGGGWDAASQDPASQDSASRDSASQDSASQEATDTGASNV